MVVKGRVGVSRFAFLGAMMKSGGLPELLLPWELGPMAALFGNTSPLGHVADAAALAAAVSAGAATMQSTGAGQPASGTLLSATMRSAGAGQPASGTSLSVAASSHTVAVPGRRQDPGRDPDADDAADFERAVDRWVLIVTVARDAAPVWARTRGVAGPLKCSVRDVLASKAPSTALARAGALLKFCRWSTAAGEPPFPATEDAVYRYVQAIRPSAATAAKRFLEALAFGGGLFEIAGALDAISPRARGGAVAGLKRKRPTVKKDVYCASVVSLLEEAMVGAFRSGLNDLDRVMVGLLLFRIHARARCGDVVRARHEPVLDLADGAGYIETQAAPREHKRAFGASAGTSLPIVALAYGVTGRPWAEAWLDVRRKVGISAEASQCLQPVILCDGSLGASRMPTGEVLRWDKCVLTKLEVDVQFVQGVGTHSAKSTLLSWAAKAGMRHGWRRLLGGHAAGKDKSMLEYSRDALAQPLRELEQLLGAVRDGRFKPDATRSGRWAGTPPPGQPVQEHRTPASASEDEDSVRVSCASCEVQFGEVEVPTLCDQCAAAVHDAVPCIGECRRCQMHFCGACRPRDQHVCDEGAPSSSAESSGSSAVDEELDKDEAVAEAVVAIEFGESQTVLPPLPAEGLVRHVVTQNVHRAMAAGVEAPRCNLRVAAASLQWLDDWPTFPWPLCRRKGCFYAAAD